jgi:hypothetical protein
MAVAAEIEPVDAEIFLWRLFDPAVKAELFSTGLMTPSGIYMVDPVPLGPESLAEIAAMGKVLGIFVTNENHDRASAEFAERFRACVYRNGSAPEGPLRPIQIEGAPPAETALYSTIGNGTMIMGDALVNADPYGFALLPPKYCTDARIMRRSLAKLLDYSFERMFFAHGMPILEGARSRLESLLNEHG